MVRVNSAVRSDAPQGEAGWADSPWYVRLMAEQGPLGYNAGDTNLYRYVGNNPTNATDPSGLEKSPTYNRFHEGLASLSLLGSKITQEARRLADKAEEAARKRFPGAILHNDRGDAWRHCYWSALMRTRLVVSGDFNLSSSPNFTDSKHVDNVAHYIGWMHEEFGKKAGQPPIQYAMDMHNNEIGLQIGAPLGKNASEEKISAACDKALADGKLIWIERDKLTKSATYQVIDHYKIKHYPFARFQSPVKKTLRNRARIT